MDHLKKSIAIHQPNYFPWVGYFYKIFMADKFVFHDDVIFSQRSFTKRTKVRKEYNEMETQWLGIPVIDSKQLKIKEVRINHQAFKQKRLLNKIEYLYHNTPYFDYHFPTIMEIVLEAKKHEFLSTYNIYAIKKISELLKIDSEFHCSSFFNFSLKGSSYNLALIEALGTNHYYSGIGAKGYQIDDEFVNRKIKLTYLDTFSFLEKNPYSQKQGDFIPGLSIIDTILNIGVVGIQDLFQRMKFQQELEN